MPTLIHLKIKEQLSYVLPTVLILVSAILFGSSSSIALSDRQPVFRVALYDADSGNEAADLANNLAEMPGLDIVLVDSRTAGEDMINRREAESLIIVNEGFTQAIETNTPGAVTILPAPGSMSSGIIAEAVALSILKTTTMNILREELIAIDESLAERLEEVHAQYAVENPVLTVAYEGPDLMPDGAPIPAKHGIEALFLLLSALHAAFVLPGISGIINRAAKLKNLTATIIALLAVWTAQLTLYLLTMSLFFGELPNLQEAVALFALIAFNIGLGAIFSAFCKKKELAAYFFIPYFLLNMTLGGGLWGRLAEFGIIVDILLPVSGALRGEPLNIVLLFTMAILMIGVALWRQDGSVNPQRNRSEPAASS
jgi:hypothetical protein